MSQSQDAIDGGSQYDSMSEDARAESDLPAWATTLESTLLNNLFAQHEAQLVHLQSVYTEQSTQLLNAFTFLEKVYRHQKPTPRYQRKQQASSPVSGSPTTSNRRPPGGNLSSSSSHAGAGPSSSQRVVGREHGPYYHRFKQPHHVHFILNQGDLSPNDPSEEGEKSMTISSESDLDSD
ncbi:hypothetical protein DM01DRAFT_325902 [Hesseltinella vesiculosa]|uniref:Uncharacterized protein n=1 Tax=Hesseltinella vesiculosa TaxID=101127 RepID=A0A1X2G7T2_9FUNG|nr:hypothetical protein DM01DRAFT_325902 [Hesseltinella vesiculosa]